MPLALRRLVRKLCLLLACAVCLAEQSHACRIIDPRPIIIIPPQPEPRPQPEPLRQLSTKRHTAEIAIDGQLTTVKLEAVFHNPNGVRIEGTYFFPLPPEVAVKGFSMFVNGKEMKGELLDAGRARQVYEDIVRRQKDPGLLEYAGQQMLKLRVFPIEANADVTVRLEYNHLVAKDNGAYAFSYPLKSAQPADGGDIGEVALRVSLKSNIALKNVYSPTHKIDLNRNGEFAATVGFEGKGVRPERDFCLYWSEAEQDVGVSLLTHAQAGEDGYFMLLLSPRVEAAPGKEQPRDLVLVLDTSGSMAEGNKIVQARRALKYCLSKLKPIDRFNIVTFSTGVQKYADALLPADAENVRAALEFADKIEAAGGTAMDEAVGEGLAALKDAKGLPLLLFLTDGLPTIGETDPERILKNAKEKNAASARLFVFGVGYDVNAKLLDQLADEGRGMRDYVKPEEDIEVKVSGLYDKISSPALSDVALDFGGLNVYDVFPKTVPDLFRGGQRVVLGRYSGGGSRKITVSGSAGGERKEYAAEVTLGERKACDFLPALWAARKCGYLLDQIRLNGEKEELVKEVMALGKKFGIVTPYTSFLVVEDNLPAAPGLPGQPRRAEEVARDKEKAAKVENELHQGFVDGAAAGKDAVLRSNSVRSLSAEAPEAGGWSAKGGFGGEVRERLEALDDADGAASGVKMMEMKQAGGKTFYHQGGMWVDSELEEDWEENAVEVEFLGEEYFKLLAAAPGLAQVFALGDNLAVNWEGKVYRIVRPSAPQK